MIDAIKIGSRVYTVCEADRESDKPGEVVLGEIVYTEGNIYLKAGMCSDETAQVICHEYAHGQMYRTGMNEVLDEKEKERWAQFIGMCIAEFVKENPNAVRMIQGTDAV